MQSQQQSLSPEAQAVLDLCEIQGVPVKFENSVFVIKKIDLPILHDSSKPKYLATQNIDTVIRWMEQYQLWNRPKQSSGRTPV
jgi:hypothetical protein